MGLYIQMISVHGLIRPENPEMGKNADTGGQVKYVLELARALARRPEVDRVDLLTRLIRDRAHSQDYAEPFAPLVEEDDPKARLVRIQCGGTQHRRKELLWPHLDEYVDKTLKYTRSQRRIPDVIHGHYADSGYVAMQLSTFLGANFVFTGHSLGWSKRRRLLETGMREEEIERRYRLNHRIGVEEDILRLADLVVASTRHEVRAQYGEYRNAAIPRYDVAPPGLDLEKFYPYYDEHAGLRAEDEKQAAYAMKEELKRFLLHPDKPLILALARPEKRKNLAGLLHAYGTDKELQAMANLAVFAGIRKDIAGMPEDEREVLTELLLLMDRYDLYGKLAIPKRHECTWDVPALYRLAASKRGVFVNCALTEPFGLTLLEAAACGLPIVATDDGGPIDIVENCRNGVLVPVTEQGALNRALRQVLTDDLAWRDYSSNGVKLVRAHYSWDTHCARYVERIRELEARRRPRTQYAISASNPLGKRLIQVERALVTSVVSLSGDQDAAALRGLRAWIQAHRADTAWIVASGRPVREALAELERLGLGDPDVMITSVGTEIHYGPALMSDAGWTTHISADWNRARAQHALQDLEFLTLQPADLQHRFKLSYYMPADNALLERVRRRLDRSGTRYNLIHSHGTFLDVLPYRAGKGKALRYLCYKWGWPLDQTISAVGSGNDEGMLRGDFFGIVPANHLPELGSLRGRRRVYFSASSGAAGILEGLSRCFLERSPAVSLGEKASTEAHPGSGIQGEVQVLRHQQLPTQ